MARFFYMIGGPRTSTLFPFRAVVRSGEGATVGVAGTIRRQTAYKRHAFVERRAALRSASHRRSGTIVRGRDGISDIGLVALAPVRAGHHRRGGKGAPPAGCAFCERARARRLSSTTKSPRIPFAP